MYGGVFKYFFCKLPYDLEYTTRLMCNLILPFCETGVIYLNLQEKMWVYLVKTYTYVMYNE